MVSLVSCYPTNSLQVCYHSFFTLASVGMSVSLLAPMSQWLCCVSFGSSGSGLRKGLCLPVKSCPLLALTPLSASLPLDPPPHLYISVLTGRDAEATAAQGGRIRAEGFSLAFCPDWFSQHLGYDHRIGQVKRPACPAAVISRLASSKQSKD